MKRGLRFMGIIVWAIGMALIVYLLIQNTVVPYDQINQRSFNIIETVGVVLIVLGILLTFIINFKRKKTLKES